MVYGDARAYLASARFNKPGTIPLIYQTEVRDGCPSDCGLCPEHKQHACLGIIEVNTNCNLDCPICFADSGHQPDGYSITVEQCERMLDVLVESEGEYRRARPHPKARPRSRAAQRAAGGRRRLRSWHDRVRLGGRVRRHRRRR